MKFEIYKETLLSHVTFEEAVMICSKLGQGWRLPSKLELIEMFEMQKRGEINFGNYGCWSSSVDQSKMIWSLGFLTGNIYLNPSTNLNLVRPVRNVVGKDYWASDLPLPLSPSDSDVDIYKNNMIEGGTLMLGCTKKLISITTIQMDIDPWYESDTLIKSDWLDNKTYYDNIITDGSLSFTKEFTDSLIEMASKNCKVFIARTFTKRLPIMRIADYFPQPEDFKILPTKTLVFEDYSFYIWHF